jgi:hypothetical protein
MLVLLLSDPHAAVRGDDTHDGSTGAQLRLNPLSNHSLDGDREINVHPAIDGACFEAGVIRPWKSKRNPAIGRSQIEATSPPRAPGKSRSHATVGRFSAHIASYILDPNSSVRRLEIEISLD